MASALPVVERFHSLQGEGAHAGKSAFFIRLASCKVGCQWCDTKHSWSAENFPKEDVRTLAEDVSNAQRQGASFVVLTGGEPLHHNLESLCSTIKKVTQKNSGCQIPIHLETSGVDQLSGAHDWITLSPKPHYPPQTQLLIACNEIKVIVHEKNDLVFAQEVAEKAINEKRKYNNQISSEKSKLSSNPLLFLQPGWNRKEGFKLAIEYVKNNPTWRLSLQTHKWVGVR